IDQGKRVHIHSFWISMLSLSFGIIRSSWQGFSSFSVQTMVRYQQSETLPDEHAGINAPRGVMI
ncbi:hypothetical protein, partial [Hydrogenoanaerobacterium sp.]|uniref:hypothetical protein n=1 Tax=Hydrogenoanaerobacterium sp. TaxID=2953763 RepID=UPI00289CBBBC